jgi:leucyl aminopeptidase
LPDFSLTAPFSSAIIPCTFEVTQKHFVGKEAALELRIEAGKIAGWRGDGIVVNLFEGAQEPIGEGAEVDRALGGIISQVIRDSGFKAELSTSRVFYSLGRIPAARVCVVGLGKQQDFTLDRARRAAAYGVKALRRAGAKSVATIVHGAGFPGIDLASAAQANAEGILMGLWRFQKYHTSAADELQEEEFRYEIERVTIVTPKESDLPVVREAAVRGRIIGDATNFARELANEPGNALTPMRLSEIARQIAEKNGLEFYVIDREEARRKGMGAFLGVAQGSSQPPAMIVMRYWGGDKEQPGGLGLIGKGITFDSGGISLKPGENMEHMKGDMSGGAAVIGAMQAIAQLKPKTNVTGIVAATENMPGGNAYKPGDILRAMNGKTIEVVNTDAEGRLVLADAVAYATLELKLDTVLDAATLTGAMVVALGYHRTGFFANDDRVAAELMELGTRTGERMWQLPMDKEYKEQLKSEWADIKNTGGRPAGSITAAWFIRSFVENGARWAHLDIAGSTQLGDGKPRGYINKWGTGVPTRTFIEMALERGRNSI